MLEPVLIADDHPVARSRDLVRDPVLLIPGVVAAGLAIGWLGVQEQVSGTRVAADLALAWALVAASAVAMDRPRWRRARWLLAAGGFALLGADLAWSGSHPLWTLGLLLQGLWAVLLLQVVVSFPEGRPWSRPATVAIVAAYAAAFGGQLVGAFVGADSRDALSVAAHETFTDWVDSAQEISVVVLALAALVLVVRRLRILRSPARRAQGPPLVVAAVTLPMGIVWLSWVIATDGGTATLDTVGRAVAVAIPLGVVTGVVWSRLRRPATPELVVQLRTEPAASLRARLARALDDPTLDIVYRLDDGRYVDPDGRTVELPHGADRAVTSLIAGGQEVAAIVHDPALLDEPALVESVRAAAGLVLENERLAAEVRSQLSEVRASRGRIVAAGDAERQRIERDLHDGSQQRLVTLSVALGLEAARADARTADVLSRAQDEIEQAIGELRELARGIHPTLLRDQGLQAAVEALARRAALPVSVHGTVRDRQSEAVELAAYFVVSEALTNVVKHASATQATVLLEREPGTLRVTIVDDGVGGARVDPGSGLAGLVDRLDALDATLAVESPPGRGTTVRAELPCES